MGIKPGDDVVMKVKEKELLIKRGVSPEKFVNDFCAVAKRKLTRKIDLERILEEEAEERLALR